MEYQNVINFVDNASTKFRTENWVEIKDDVRGTYNKDSQIKFKTSTLKSSLCDYSNEYVLVKGTISIARVLAPTEPDNVGKEVVFKNCAPFTDSKVK